MNRRDYHWKIQAKKWMRRYTFALDIIVLILGIIIVIVGNHIGARGSSTGPNANDSDHASNSPVSGSVCVNIGCGLIASGILALIMYPSLDGNDQVAFQNIHDELGLLDITESSSILCAGDSKWRLPRDRFDLITSHENDISVLCSQRSQSKKLKVRIIVRQPSLMNNPNSVKMLERWAAQSTSEIKIKYYSGNSLPWYSRQDSYTYWGQGVNESGSPLYYFYKYDVNATIGKLSDAYFDRIWNQQSSEQLLTSSTQGRTCGSQKDCIEAILHYFCTSLRTELNLKTDIEAVVVIWTKKQQKRMTFYSCNKQKGASTGNIRDYGWGVVGLLQDQLKNNQETDSVRTDCILLYDHEKDATECEYIIDWRSGEIRKEKVAEQTWKNKSTKAMLAISLFRETEGQPEVFGALTYDFAETLKSITEAQRMQLFHAATACRELLLPLLSTNIQTDYESHLIKLEEAEK